MQPLPAGIQEFSIIREENHLYVDKTGYMLSIIRGSKYVFFSRPRRFGKSLLCSTLRCFYEGRQALFEGLYIYDKVDWVAIQRPVIHLDMNGVTIVEGDFGHNLDTYMDSLLALHGVTLSPDIKGSRGKLTELIHTLAQRAGKRVAVIVDEYDKPLTEVLGNEEKFNYHRDILRDFYSVFKSLDISLEKVFVTGVSKYGKTSIFSTLNNLTDISLNEEYATMCGYTPEELEGYFGDYLAKTALKFQKTIPELLAEMRLRYNGYSFDGTTTVYNPYAVLCFFLAQKFKNFWFDTGTPYFLLKLLRQYKINYDTLEHIKAEITILDMADAVHQSVIALLFQTGYLTIHEEITEDFDTYYKLGFPNIEVKQAFSQYVLAEYFVQGTDFVLLDIATPIRTAFRQHDIASVINIMQNRVYPHVPYQLYDTKEAYYHTIFHVTMNTIGFRTTSEVMTNIGRIDMIIETYDTIFIFEFKLDESADVAIEQIKQKKYYQKYLAYGYPIWAIGINFSTEKRNIVDYKMVEIG